MVEYIIAFTSFSENIIRLQKEISSFPTQYTEFTIKKENLKIDKSSKNQYFTMRKGTKIVSPSLSMNKDSHKNIESSYRVILKEGKKKFFFYTFF